MKTLADLKRNAKNYVWSLKENSWFKQIPQFQRDWRSVSIVQSTKMAFDTNKDGIKTQSWMDFPKASELQIIPLGNDMFTIIIKQVCEQTDNDIQHWGKKPDHIMIYELKPKPKYFDIYIESCKQRIEASDKFFCSPEEI